MPHDTTTITVGEAVDELDERLDEIADEADAEEDGSDDQTQLDRLGATLDQRLAALEELQQEATVDGEFVIAELTPGERVEFGDLLEATRDEQQRRQGVEGGSNMRDLFWVAAGVVDAPWLDGEETLQERVVATRTEADWHVIQYLKTKVTEANAKGNPERRSYAQRRAERTQTNEPT